MTGFKEGASESPFDDDPEEETGADTTDPDAVPESSTDRAMEDRKSTDATAEGDTQLPWTYERDSVRDGRTTRQIHLLPDTMDREREFRSTVEGALGESIKKADLREAALLVAMEHPDEVADQLRKWGYDY